MAGVFSLSVCIFVVFERFVVHLLIFLLNIFLYILYLFGFQIIKTNKHSLFIRE